MKVSPFNVVSVQDFLFPAADNPILVGKQDHVIAAFFAALGHIGR